MRKRAYASWVVPIAATLAEERLRLIEFARGAPPPFWNRMSETSMWRYKDTLAHVAGGNDRLVQTLLRSAVTGVPPEPGSLNPDTDDANARGVSERRNLSIEDLIAELEADGDETQDLLSRLREDDGDMRWDGFELTLGQFLKLVEHERHDLEHLRQLQAGVTRT